MRFEDVKEQNKPKVSSYNEGQKCLDTSVKWPLFE